MVLSSLCVVLALLCGINSAITVPAAARETTPIAFSAELAADKDYYESTTVVFDRNIYNGNGIYFNTSGQFACVDNDVYVFAWSLARASYSTTSRMRAFGQIQLAGSPIQNGARTSYYGTTSINGPSEFVSVVKCQTSPPSAVTINLMPWSTSDPVSRLKALYTSFSGFKLAAAEDGVAFAAVVSEDFSAFSGTKIVYDTVLHNYGDAYYKGYGAFVCPDDGLYVFTVTSSVSDTNTRWATSRLMMNGNVVTVGPMTYSTSTNGDSGTASMTTVLQCQQGLDVYNEATKAHTYSYNTYGAEYSSFTGFRLNYQTLAVGFTATLSQNHTSGSSPVEMAFNNVVTNAGGAYQGPNGRFVCPDNDLYVFTVTAVSTLPTSPSIYMNSLLIKQSYTSAVSSSDSSGTSGSCTNSVVYRCQLGAYVTVHDDTASSTGQVYLAEYTSFSGYKVPNQ